MKLPFFTASTSPSAARTVAKSIATSVVASAGLLAGGLTIQAPAQAFSYTTNFTAELSGDDAAKGNIWLDSVTLGNGTVIDDFAMVTGAEIISNDLWIGGNTGAASADMGDLADGIQVEDASSLDIMNALNNNNLNNIIDTEDTGNFAMNLFFEESIDQVFLWERGRNSKLALQAIDAEGNTLGSLVELDYSSEWDYAGYDIDTMEIGDAQQVGSMGVSLDDFGLSSSIAGLRVVSESGFNGPDWKLMGAKRKVPEPSAMAGLSLMMGGLLLRRRRRVRGSD